LIGSLATTKNRLISQIAVVGKEEKMGTRTAKAAIAVKIQTIQEVINLLEEMRIRAIHQADLWDKQLVKKTAKDEAATLTKVIKVLSGWLDELQGGE
jgi:hypothetical protein